MLAHIVWSFELLTKHKRILNVFQAHPDATSCAVPATTVCLPARVSLPDRENPDLRNTSFADRDGGGRAKSENICWPARGVPYLDADSEIDFQIGVRFVLPD